MAKKIIVLLWITLVYVATVKTGRTDGIKDQEPADKDVKGLVAKLSEEILTKIKDKSCASNKANCFSPDDLEALTMRKLKVAGITYFVKIRASELVGKSAFYHVKIYHQPSSETLEVRNVEGPKKESDPL